VSTQQGGNNGQQKEALNKGIVWASCALYAGLALTDFADIRNVSVRRSLKL